MQTQEELEEMQRVQGVNRYRKKVAQAKAKSRESTVGAGAILMKRTVDHLTAAIKEEHAKAAPVGRSQLALPLIKQVAPEVAAFIATKTVVDTISQRLKLQGIQIKIGQRIEDELKFSAFEDQHPEAYAQVARKAAKSGDYRYKHRIMTHAMTLTENIQWDAWSVITKMHVGAKLLDLLIESTGIVHAYRDLSGGGKNTPYYLRASEETLQALRTADAHSELLQPWLMPMIEPPKPWTSPFNGGYRSQILTLVKTNNKDWLEQLMWREMPVVYDGINKLQRTPWKINRDVLEVASTLWEAGSQIAGLPMQEDWPLPPKPEDIDDDPTVRSLWKYEAKLVHDRNARRQSHTAEAAFTLALAEQFKENTIWFPHTLDWRGRAYPAPAYLQPQGGDLAKGLLSFADSLPLASESAARWLAIHGANVWGNDKVSLDERVDWVRGAESWIRRVSEDPLTELAWTEADKPWCFLAFCLDWAGYLDEGLSHRSNLPVAMDGTCNGLQHLSAAIRDEAGGRAVNLTPTATPQDLYSEVAVRLTQKLGDVTQDVSVPPGMVLAAEKWRASGEVNRQLVKRQCMTLPYGATQRGMQNMLMEEMAKRQDNHGDPIFEDPFGMILFLNRQIWDSIQDSVPGALAAMRYIQGISAASSADKLPMMWDTPSGFPVFQRYVEEKTHRIRTQIAGTVVRLSIKSPTNNLNARKQRAGSSPNWVHSMDAAHLMLSIHKCPASMSFAMVHDSYGTHAADADYLARTLRETFVDIYTTDQLQALGDQHLPLLSDRAKRKLEPLPVYGELDIQEVINAEYFFA